MHALKGRKQSPEHVAKRARAMVGKPRPLGSGRPANTPEALWSKVDRRAPDECWEWQGFRNEDGYGRTWIGGKGYYAHRVIFDLANPGKIERTAPRNRFGVGFLRHSCDNPPCCNPRHLLIGSQSQNMGDKIARERGPDFSEDKGPRCKLSMQQARLARQRRALGESARALAEAFGISLASMKALLAGKSYKEGGA